MPSLTTEGIILKHKDFGEADRVLTAYTERLGKISITARGLRRITSRRSGNVEVLNRVRLHLYQAKTFTLTEAEGINSFQPLKENLTLSTSAFHVIELIDRLTVEDQANLQVYNLLLSILELLVENPRQIFIRAFEVKLMTVLGFWSITAVPNLTDEMKGLLEKLEYSSWEQISQLKINEAQSQSLQITLQQYIEKILESNLRSLQVMKKLRKK